ncbi:MAG: chemotaxis protein CheW [Nitrospirota bacterium]|nr:chemotaxis protein CheW [Nitrospirota bacterium]
MTNNYLLFRLGDRLFGISMEGALEILPWRKSRMVPLAYSYIEGLLDYRGTIYPVFQLALLLGLSRPGPIGFTAPDPMQPLKDRSIVLLREGDRRFGITVDSVVKMARLEHPDDQTSDIKGIQPHLILGRSFDEDQEIILLRFERLFHAG